MRRSAMGSRLMPAAKLSVAAGREARQPALTRSRPNRLVQRSCISLAPGSLMASAPVTTVRSPILLTRQTKPGGIRLPAYLRRQAGPRSVPPGMTLLTPHLALL